MDGAPKNNLRSGPQTLHSRYINTQQDRRHETTYQSKERKT